MKLVYPFIVGIVSSSIVGVDPADSALYEPLIENGKKVWKCLSDPSIVLDYEQINNNYCDCPDGSDEPGTNACAKNRKQFYCANVGHFPGYIEHFKLNDGVCDYDVCCDGSDEWLFKDGKQCPNKCLEINNQYRKYKEGAIKQLENSLAIKKKLESESLNMRKELQEGSQIIAQEIEAEEIRLSGLRQRLEDHGDNVDGDDEENEDSVEEGGALLYNVLEPVISKLSTAIDHDRNEYKKVHQLEDILLKLINNYNPNFNDAAVKEAVRTYQDYISNKADENVDETLNSQALLQEVVFHTRTFVEPSQQESKDTVEETSASYGAPTFSNMVHYYFELLISKFLNAPEAEEEGKFYKREEQAPLKKSSSIAYTSLSQEIEILEQEIQDSKKHFSSIEKDLSLDYGPSDILRAVRGQWVSNKLGEYNYNFGFFDTIYQDGNGNNVHIGTFSTIEDGHVLVYNRGARCWNGPQRSAKVKLVCGEEPKLLSVSEPEKCEYHFELQTPIVCQELTEEELIKNFKVDYTQL
ncbi:putative glucosidase 2 subunit beta [[Candida] railenensis]|uniref:Glucosidase 2 subunit beta n=1 Tax=[Candida] railenensis TaxID=45579 RepID=A0A9P0QP47_9ASCO|nr:putative glucosidase 2 subunit beta [[Candida] railenensis]